MLWDLLGRIETLFKSKATSLPLTAVYRWENTEFNLKSEKKLTHGTKHLLGSVTFCEDVRVLFACSMVKRH